MKKVLVILSLALALTMFSAVAVADDVDYIDVDWLDHFDSCTFDATVKEATCTEGGLDRYFCPEESYTDEDGEEITVYHLLPTPKLPHSWDDGEVTTEATCEENGIITYTCTECGETKEEEIPALGHLWDSEITDDWGEPVDGEPTCTEGAEYADFCHRCGETGDNTRWVDPIDHKFTEKQYNEDDMPSCLNGLTSTYVLYCEVCGGYEEDPDNLKNGESDVDWENWWSVKTASAADALKDNPDWKDWMDTLDSKGHQMDTWTEENPDHYKCEDYAEKSVCLLCGLTVHRITPSSIDEAARYEGAPIEYERVDCYYGVVTQKCIYCDGEVEGHVLETEVESERHDWDWENYKIIEQPTTCTEPGLREYTCKICGKTEQWDWWLSNAWDEEGNPMHIFGEWITYYDPTDSQKGVYAHSCLVCGYIEYGSAESMPEDGGYELIDEWDAGCEYPGGKIYSNGNEDEDIHVDTTPALGHDYVTKEKEATCTEAGFIMKVCTRCGDYELTDIPSLGHTPEVIPAVAPTTEKAGSTEGSKCSVCGEILVEPEEIPAIIKNEYSVSVAGGKGTVTVTGTEEVPEMYVRVATGYVTPEGYTGLAVSSTFVKADGSFLVPPSVVPGEVTSVTIVVLDSFEATGSAAYADNVLAYTAG